MKKRYVAGIGALMLAAIGLAGCGSMASPAQQNSQNMTERIAAASTDPNQGGVAFPFDALVQGGFLEDKMLREHTERQANPATHRWVVVVTQMGQVFGQWPIQGMVFDPNSQMTATKIVTCNPRVTSSNCDAVVDAPGDNGTYGPEAGSAAFFTTSGVEIQVPHGMLWFESDAPLNITGQPMVTLNANATPSYNAGGVHVGS